MLKLFFIETDLIPGTFTIGHLHLLKVYTPQGVYNYLIYLTKDLRDIEQSTN
jgi:hypothetical protein